MGSTGPKISPEKRGTNQPGTPRTLVKGRITLHKDIIGLHVRNNRDLDLVRRRVPASTDDNFTLGLVNELAKASKVGGVDDLGVVGGFGEGGRGGGAALRGAKPGKGGTEPGDEFGLHRFRAEDVVGTWGEMVLEHVNSSREENLAHLMQI